MIEPGEGTDEGSYSNIYMDDVLITSTSAEPEELDEDLFIILKVEQLKVESKRA